VQFAVGDTTSQQLALVVLAPPTVWTAPQLPSATKQLTATMLLSISMELVAVDLFFAALPAKPVPVILTSVSPV
jgi:hypothetical protein